MAKSTRTKELWHIPKRGSVHQTIYMVYVLSWDKFLGKSWSSGKQEEEYVSRMDEVIYRVSQVMPEEYK